LKPLRKKKQACVKKKKEEAANVSGTMHQRRCLNVLEKLNVRRDENRGKRKIVQRKGTGKKHLEGGRGSVVGGRNCV